MKNWKLTEEGFELSKPFRYRPWLNYLSNPDYGMRISHLGDGYATTLKLPRRTITHYDNFAPIKGRFVYVRDEDTLWSPSFLPVKEKLDSYSCIHAPGYTQWKSSKNEIETESLVMLPLYGAYEIWKVQVTNHSDRIRKVSVFPQVEFLLYPSLAVDPVYYSWFTNTRWDKEKGCLIFSKTDSTDIFGFFRAVTTPDAFESSLKRFEGDGDMQDPEALRRSKLANGLSGGDPYIGCFQYDLKLPPGESQTLAFCLGEGKENLALCEKGITVPADAELELAAVKKHWQDRLFRKEFQSVEHDNLRSYLQTFFGYQIYQQAEGLVRSTWHGYRDVAQDAMGLSYYDPKGARRLLLDLCIRQYDNGRCLRQWNTEGGANDERDFRDLPLWFPVALAKYIENTGDSDILNEVCSYHESDKTGTVFEHVIKGFGYILRYGPHELLEIGVGDWNDALSGLSPKGESLWLSQFAYYALSKVEVFVAQYGQKTSYNLAEEKDRLYAGVVAQWTGKWFARGFHEDGTRIGGEDRIFLLPQAWFTISGMAERDPEKAKIALDSMVEKLDNENGLLLCHPAFDKYDPIVGNLSALAPGLAENYAIYNHASAFGIYALLKAGRDEDAVRYLQRLIPVFKDPARTYSEPFVLVNYYNGGFYPEKAGEGGVPWLTGTVHWLALSLFEEAIPRGVKIG